MSELNAERIADLILGLGGAGNFHRNSSGVNSFIFPALLCLWNL